MYTVVGWLSSVCRLVETVFIDIDRETEKRYDKRKLSEKPPTPPNASTVGPCASII